MTIIPNSEYILLKVQRDRHHSSPLPVCSTSRLATPRAVNRSGQKINMLLEVNYWSAWMCIQSHTASLWSVYTLYCVVRQACTGSFLTITVMLAECLASSYTAGRHGSFVRERKLCGGRCLFKHEAPCSSKPCPSHHSLVPLVPSLSVCLPRLFQAPKKTASEKVTISSSVQ